MAFGDKNKGKGFGAGGGSFGGSLSKKNGGKTTESHFGKSGKNSSSVGSGGFGSKNISGAGFGRPITRVFAGSERTKSTGSDMPMLVRTDDRGEKKPLQIKRTKIVTFSNVRWQKFDNIRIHPSGTQYNEPRVHVIANSDNIEFHGYNVSEMDEGVYYKIGRNDDFEIECDVDTSKIIPHPGGYFYISFGIVSARINENGGDFLLGEKQIANVGSKFRMKLSLTDSGIYSVYINGSLRGEKTEPTTGAIKITLGFKHDPHNCKKLSHAYVKHIKMRQRQVIGDGAFGSV